MHGKPVIIFTFMSLCICLLLYSDFGKSSSLLMYRILDLGHVPLFAVVVGMILWVLDRKNWFHADKWIYVQAFLISVLLALVTEIIQHFTPERSFQIGDIVYDVIGSGVLLLVAYQYRHELPSGKRLTMISVAAVLLLASSIPLLCTAADELRAKQDFPMIGSFESFVEKEQWKSKESSFERVFIHATDGEHTLKVVFHPGLYPGITMEYPHRNWQGYNTLSFDTFLDGNNAFPLTVRINDLEHNEEYRDRYNRTFILQPGPNHVIIDLSEVEHAPKGRLMDMEHIAVLCIFSYKLKEQHTAYFDNFRLE